MRVTAYRLILREEDKMSSAQSDFYEQYMKKLKSRAEEAVKDAQKKAFAEYFEVADEKIRDIYKKTIYDFYASYDRSFYKPREGGSLYKLIETKVGDDYLDMWFEESRISYRDDGYSGEDGLYNQVFRQGWHGGANIGGNMLVPWAAPPVKYDGEETPWSSRKPGTKYGWKQAEKAPISPLDDFKNRIDKYQKSEYQQDYEKIWNKHKGNIKISMS